MSDTTKPISDERLEDIRQLIDEALCPDNDINLIPAAGELYAEVVRLRARHAAMAGELAIDRLAESGPAFVACDMPVSAARATLDAAGRLQPTVPLNPGETVWIEWRK